ncbi:hypothetical protein HPB47_002776 [Ixodes persulcatus]|uniref:Uncharacterized protein n=1 Tax=Ixodes persulcatus TaxID=34615 RepID=A0AC60PKC3_IXOPE|nr:hypothetical protein HPB47_002776 [Ixodes persulcatus]
MIRKLPMVSAALFRFFLILALTSPTFAGLLRGNDGRGLGVTYVDEEDYYSETTTTSLSPGVPSVTSTVSASYKSAPEAATVASVTEVEHTAPVASVTTTEEVTHVHPPAPVATVTTTEEVTHAHHSVPVAAVTTTTEVTEVQHSAPDLAAAPSVKPVHVATEVTTFDAAPAVANYHASPSVVTFHAAPTAATVTHVSPVFTTETHVAPVYSYGVGSLGYGTGNYGYGHGLGAYGLNYGYGLGDPVEYAILLRRRKSVVAVRNRVKNRFEHHLGAVIQPGLSVMRLDSASNWDDLRSEVQHIFECVCRCARNIARLKGRSSAGMNVTRCSGDPKPRKEARRGLAVLAKTSYTCDSSRARCFSESSHLCRQPQTYAAAPAFATVAHAAPVYGYGVSNLGYGVGHYGYGHGLGSYGLNYGYGLGTLGDYTSLLRKKKYFQTQSSFHKLEEYESLMKRGGWKRLGEETSSAKEPKKQPRLEFSGKRSVSQQKLHQLVTTFVVEGLHAFSIVEENASSTPEDFFSFGQQTLQPEAQDELSRYLLVPVDHPLSQMKSFEGLHRLFLKYNTAVPSRCVDGTQIAIKGPSENDPRFTKAAYWCRKNYYALNAMIVCDADLWILNVDATFPGSVHDSFVWRMSFLREAFLQGHFLREDECLLGDSGYPLEPWLLNPVPGNPAVGSDEARFNQAHRSTRSVVERCIGMLKNRFRCLQR